MLIFNIFLYILLLHISLTQIKNRFINSTLLTSKLDKIESLLKINLTSLRIYLYEIVYVFGLLGVFSGFLLLLGGYFGKLFSIVFYLLGYGLFFKLPTFKSVFSSSNNEEYTQSLEFLYYSSVLCGIMIA
jgi:hypothetical protein